MSRLFLVGNGPSLRDTKLSRLVSEESWASGRIDLIYPDTNWRPTRAFWGEWPKGQKDYDSILTHFGEGYPYWMREDAAMSLAVKYVPMDLPAVPLSNWRFQLPVDFPEQVRFYDWCGSLHAGMFQDRIEDNVPTTWHFPLLCRFGSTMHIMLQQAVKEGRKEIYLIVNDLEFTAGHDNYFDDDYQLREWNERKADLTNRTHVYAHGLARKFATAAGVAIYNATIGGSLEVYPRVDYDSLF